MKKKEKEKTLPNKTAVVILVASLMCALVCVGVIKILNWNSGYKIDSRVERMKEYQVKHDDLDVSGWLMVEGTNIDYPILKNGDEIRYNDGNIQYLWENGNMDRVNRMNYVMGHNIMNLSSNPLVADPSHVRFEQLLSFAHYDFVKENKYVQFTVGDKDYLFKIFAVTFPDASEASSLNGDLYKDEDVKETIEKSLKESVFDFDVDVNEKDNLITLSTCTRMFGNNARNFQVIARQVRDGESTINYKVTKNDKYKEIEEKMKEADVTNEA